VRPLLLEFDFLLTQPSSDAMAQSNSGEGVEVSGGGVESVSGRGVASTPGGGWVEETQARRRLALLKALSTQKQFMLGPALLVTPG
jgi:hypothetical protein